MATQQANMTRHDMLTGIAAIDFSMVKLKLMDTEEGEGWSADHCDRVEREYRRYLALSRQYPGQGGCAVEGGGYLLALPHTRHPGIR